MRKLIAISVASTLLGYAIVHFVFFSKPSPAPALVPEQPAAVPAAPAEPMVLAQVVEVTDLEPLLDPLPGQPAGLPFDPTEPLPPAVPVNAAPNPIPLAD